MEEKFLIRDLINPQSILEIAERIVNSYPEFDGDNFFKEINKKLPSLEYKQRVDFVADKLDEFLPKDYPTAIRIINKSLTSELPNKEESNYNNFYIVIYNKYIINNGIDYFDLSMESLLLQTKRLTSEFGIRVFLDKYTELSFKLLKTWTQSDNIHIRRLCSEGCRPRLPWAMRLNKFIDNPLLVIEILELLKYDNEMYVRRSVANNLNDISKDHPNLVINLLSKWHDGSKNMNWLINHALRTLIKKGNKKALELIGFPEKPKIDISNFKFEDDRCKIGDEIYFSFELKSKLKQKLMIDYSVGFVKANGNNSSKIFKLSKKELKKGEVIKIRKKQSFKNYSTRTIYPGIHNIELQINGNLIGKIEINVTRD